LAAGSWAAPVSHAPSQSPPVEAHLGNAVVVLNGPWAFHAGDDLRWAEPGFDDSSWARMDLTPPADSYDPLDGSSGFVPGWTAHGYPNLAGYAWYRLRVHVANAATNPEQERLALKMPDNVDDAYQVYVNGSLIGQFGNFHAGKVTVYSAQPRAFDLPGDFRQGDLSIAIRMWMEPGTLLVAQDAGGLHSPPVLGQQLSINAMEELDWESLDRTEASVMIYAVALLFAVHFGLVLYWLDRRDFAYLWLSVASWFAFWYSANLLISYYSMLMPLVVENWLNDCLLMPLQLVAWTLFWAFWFRLDKIAELQRQLWLIGGVLVAVMSLLRAPFYGTIVPIHASVWLLPLALGLKLVLGLFLLRVVVQGIRHRGTDGWLALFPVLLMPLRLYQNELENIGVRIVVPIGGVNFTIGQIALLVMLFIVLILLTRRFIAGQREREQLEMELEQAREVQQVLIPEALPQIPGLRLASEYRPDQRVGGDFFQMIPLAGDGVLVTIGDVSGKGMPAAMTVSLLVGAVRTLATFTQDPKQMLEELNRRMIGRTQGGFTTCLIARVDADGTVTAANAGHLSPYVDGRESEVAPGLPLGIAAGIAYTETHFRLEPGQRLTLMTDGVVEARSAVGELFGFERATAIASASAAVIVEAAQRFGQQDDITVLTVDRL
jgi:hypothetical protein